MYEWECRYCDAAFRGQSPGEANKMGRDHLLDSHRGEVIDQYAQRIIGSTCVAGCGYRFPANADELADFTCAKCGKDNLAHYAGKDVWAGIDRQ